MEIPCQLYLFWFVEVEWFGDLTALRAVLDAFGVLPAMNLCGRAGLALCSCLFWWPRGFLLRLLRQG